MRKLLLLLTVIIITVGCKKEPKGIKGYTKKVAGMRCWQCTYESNIYITNPTPHYETVNRTFLDTFAIAFVNDTAIYIDHLFGGNTGVIVKDVFSCDTKDNNTYSVNYYSGSSGGTYWVDYKNIMYNHVHNVIIGEVYFRHSVNSYSLTFRAL